MPQHREPRSRVARWYSVRTSCLRNRGFTHPALFQALLKTKAGPPFDPWVTLGWPLGDPGVTQSQSQTQSQNEHSAEGRNFSCLTDAAGKINFERSSFLKI